MSYTLSSSWLVLLGASCALMSSITGCKRTETSSASVAATPSAATTAAALRSTRGPAAQRPPASVPQPASLVTLEQTDAQCSWSVLQPPQLEPRPFLITPMCPFNNGLVWDRGGGRSFFALQGTLYLHDWQTGKLDKVGPVPIGRANPELGIAENGVLRLCDYQERPVEVDVEVAFRVTMELQADGTWQDVADVRIDEQRLDPCSGPRDPMASGSVFYEPQPRATADCPQGQVAPRTTECPMSVIVDFLGGKVDTSNDGFEFVALDDAGFVAYPTMRYANERRPIPPVFAITNTVTKLYDRALVSGSEVDLGFGGDYFVVRAASDLSQATLFKKGELAPLKEFSDATRVFWIPGTITSGPVKLQPEASAGGTQ